MATNDAGSPNNDPPLSSTDSSYNPEHLSPRVPRDIAARFEGLRRRLGPLNPRDVTRSERGRFFIQLATLHSSDATRSDTDNEPEYDPVSSSLAVPMGYNLSEDERRFDRRAGLRRTDRQVLTRLWWNTYDALSDHETLRSVDSRGRLIAAAEVYAKLYETLRALKHI